MAKKEIEYTMVKNRDDIWELASYEGEFFRDREVETFTDNEPFEATVEVVDNYKGRSASGLIVNVKGNKRYPELLARMGSVEATKLIKNYVINKGVAVNVRLKFAKRGRNYFIVNA